MRRPFFTIILVLFILLQVVRGQSNQTVTNGSPTQPVNFTGAGCSYSWTNSDPAIGLPAAGTGNIPSFTAVNKGSSPVTAKITVTPVSTGFAYIFSTIGQLAVINTTTDQVISTSPFPFNPFGETISPDGKFIYLADPGNNDVLTVDAATLQVVNAVSTGPNSSPRGIAISPDGSTLYVTNESSSPNPGSVAVINAATHTIKATVTVGRSPLGIAVSPDGSKIYVSNQVSGVSVIDAATNTILSTIPVDGSSALTLNHSGTLLYVTTGGNTISVINTATNAVLSTIAVGQNAHAVKVSQDDKKVYVVNGDSQTVSVIDAQSRTVIATISLSDASQPISISLSADGKKAYVINQNGVVSVINTATNQLDTSINTVIGAISFGDFTSAGPGCNSSPVSFTITVNPSSTSPVITAGPVTGTISACAGMASAGPNTGQFTFSGKDLGAPVLATAPAGFEISLAPNNGFGKTLTVPATSGVVSNTVVYARLSATAPPGKPSGNIVLSSAGVVKDVLVTGTVNALPTVNAIAGQKYANGNASTLIHFSGTGNTFNWTNDMPGIGLPASGSGDIETFIATNPGSSPVTAHIKVTPASEAYAYISDYAKGVLYVFNTLTNVLEKTIKIETSPGSVVVSPDGSRVYVSNTNIITNTGGTVSVINTGTNAVIATISVGRYPYGLAVSADGARLFVVNNADGTVSVINTATNKVISTILVDPSANPINLVVSPDGKTLYTIDQNYNNVGMTVAVVDILSGTVTTFIGLGMPTPPIQAPAAGIVISPDGSRVYVANSILNTISVINTTNNTVISDIPIGEMPHGLALSPDGRKLYITNGYNGYVKVLDLATGTIIAQVFLGDNQNPYDIAVSADGNFIYTENGGSYSVIDAATYAILAEVPINYAYQSDKFGNFLKSGSGCSGLPVDFTITVTPTSAVAPVINAAIATGNITACSGTASASPQIQQFAVSGNNLTGNITATSPVGFELSLTAAGGFGNTVTVTQTGGTVSGTMLYVRSAASAAAGNINGNVILSSTGAADQKVAISGKINSLPTVNIVPNQTVNSGASTTSVNFTGTGSTFTWTNNTPGIGLAASGTGNISSFIAVNTGSTPVTAAITVTPIPAGFAYITNLNDNTVSVINTTTYEIVSTIPVGKQPEGVAISKDGQTVYVTNYGSNSISVISASSNTVTSTINVGQGPYQVILSPDDSKLYVSNPNGNTISEIDIATGTVINTFVVGANPNGIRLSADGTYLYALSALTSNLYVINTATSALVATIQVGTIPSDLVISPDGSRVYVISAGSTDISVINTLNNTLIKTIHVGTNLQAICTSPDGSKIYISDIGNNEILVYNTATYDLTASIHVENQPEGISLTPDGSRLFTANQTSNTVSVINTQDNTVINTIAVGNAPASIGKFISAGSGCAGTPTTFTITVNPSSAPTITASAVTGSIIGCQGSASPNIRQFTVSGNGLTADITATAPPNFQISLNATTAYSSSLTLPETGGTVSNTIIYVRSSATAPAGSISGNVNLTSTGATSQSVVVGGMINAIPTVNAIVSQTLTSGAATSPVNFSGTATTYNWVNDMPGIGLAANGTGDIPSFTGINNTASPIIATVIVTPLNNTNCNGTPVIFTITVSPTPIPATLTTTGNLTPLATIYGTPSTAESFDVSGTNISGGILVSPPAGFEVSSNGTAFNSKTTINGNGSISSVPVYVRLAATTPTGDYSGNIMVSTNNATNLNVLIPISTVSPAPLTITANNQTKPYGAVNPVLTVTYLGFVNNDGPGQLSSKPTITTTATTQSPIAQYPILVSDAVSPNYTFTYLPGILTIEPSLSLLSIPNTFTPNGDGINDTWDIKYLEYYPKSTVVIFDRWGKKVFSSIGYPVPWDGTYNGTALPSGTYYYIIDPKNEQPVFSGWLAIIR